MSTQHDELSVLKEWYRYNSHVRKKYIAAIEELPPEEINRDRGASFPTLLDILAHTMESYSDWFFVRYGLKSPLSSERLTWQIKSIQELRSTETKIDSAVLNFVEGLGYSELDNTFETSDELNRWRFTLRQMLWHLVEEELQHRGELNALLWQM
ncbi:MAG TPA: DinB family protein, partial [Nitrososphaerales archaeon]|nr:DinB family protein [Nitrososphaerales archaeon]